MADDEIAVEIVGETPAPEGGEGNGGATPEPVDELKSQLAELKQARQRDAERAANAERAAALARNQAQEAQERVKTVEKQATAREGESIETGISAANDAIAAAKKEMKAAGEAGDFAALADAQERLSRASARLERLTEQKTEVDVRRAEDARPKPRTEPQRETAPPDAFEQMLAEMTQAGAGRSADWIRKNRDLWSDEKKNAKVRAAHFEAVSEGIAPESDEYFEFVETKVGLRKAPEPTPKPASEQARVEVKPHSRRPPVAPVAQSGGGMNGGGATVRLTKAQAEAATDGTLVWNYDDMSGKNRFKKGEPIGLVEMARRVKAQADQGLYDPNNISA